MANIKSIRGDIHIFTVFPCTVVMSTPIVAALAPEASNSTISQRGHRPSTSRLIDHALSANAITMTPVPQRTLEWLWRVLTSVSTLQLYRSAYPTNSSQNSHDPRQAYVDPQRTYSDVAHLLSQYRHFAPRTDVYSTLPLTPTHPSSILYTPNHLTQPRS